MTTLLHRLKKIKPNSVTNEHPNFNQIAEIARTDFSQILLAVELRTRELAILKVANHDKNPQGRSLSTREREDNTGSIKNEVAVIMAINRIGPHFRLPKLLPVRGNGDYKAVDKLTKSEYFAEPYYSGMPLSDLINDRGYFHERFVYLVRRANLGLLRFFCRSNILRPKSYNMLRWLGVPDSLVRPPGKIISGKKPIPVQQAILYIDQIASGLDHLHTSDGHYVHLDLKPSNVLLKKLSSQEIVIIDLGESRRQGEGATPGTRWWRAPEQHQIVKSGNREINDSRAHPAMDIYSLGVIFGYLLTGIHPCMLGSGKYRDLASTFIYPAGISKQQKKKLNDPIIVLLNSCLADDPSLRPSAEAVRTELNQIKKTLPQPKRRNRWFVLSFLFLLVVLPVFFYGASLRDLSQSVLTVFGIGTNTVTPTPTASVVLPTDTPTPTTSVVLPTNTPTSTVSVVPPTDTPTPKMPTVTPVTPATVRPVIIQIFTDNQGFVKCNNDQETISLDGNIKKFAFTVEGNLTGDVYELQMEFADGIFTTIDSFSQDRETNPPFNQSSDGTYYFFDEKFGPEHLEEWSKRSGVNVLLNRTYKWRVVIKRSGKIVGQSHDECKFIFG